MKKYFLYAAAYLFLTITLTSCEGLEQCKFCKLVTTDSSNGEVTESGETEYCGLELVAIEAAGPKTIGTRTTVNVCR